MERPPDPWTPWAERATDEGATDERATGPVQDTSPVEVVTDEVAR